ncbi:MAG: hypothetical protein RSC93_02800 [Erysipelotrichaceae bacterium]
MKILKKSYKILIIPLMVFVTLFSNIQPVSAGSETVYAWYVVLDELNHTFQGFVVEDDNGTGQKPEETYSTGYDIGDSRVYIKDSGITSSGVDIDTGSMQKFSKQDAGNVNRKYFAWTWPPDTSIAASAEDGAMAEWVNETLISSFNMATQKIISENGLTFKDAIQFLKFTNQVANSAYNTGTGSYTGIDANGKSVTATWNMSRPTKEELKDASINYDSEQGMGVNDYVRVYIGNKDNAIIVPYQVPKGYQKGQRLYQKYKDIKGANVSESPKKIGWSHMVYQASYSHLDKNINANNTDEIFNPNSMTDWLMDFIRNDVFGGIKSFLGLYSIEDLTLNQGIRAVTYYKGVMPRSWFSGASLLYWLFQIVAIFIMGIGFIKLMIERNISVINPAKKAAMMEGFMNIVYALLLTLMFIPGFILLLSVNETIISLLSSMVGSGATLTATLSKGNLIGIIIEFAFLFIVFKINITYIVRAIVVTVLYATAPFFISLLTIGEKGKNYFSIWAKEMMVNIFLQTFNAIMTVFFLSVLKYSNLKVIERFVIMMTYITLTDYFKNTLMDAKSGADGISDGATKALGTMGGTALAGILGGASGIFHRGQPQTAGGYSNRSNYGYNDDNPPLPVAEQNVRDSQQREASSINNAAKDGLKTGIVHKATNSLKSTVRAVDKNLTKTAGALYTGGKTIAAGVGRSALDVGRIGSGVLIGAAEMGTTLGMEAIGANSFEARRNLARTTSNIVGDMASLPIDSLSNLTRTMSDLSDGETGLKERYYAQDELNASGVADMSYKKLTKGQAGKELESPVGEGFRFNQGDEVMDVDFAQDGDYYNMINGEDGASARAALQNYQEAYQAKYDKPLDIAFKTESKRINGKNQKVYTGVRYSASDGDKITSTNVDGKKFYTQKGSPNIDFNGIGHEAINSAYKKQNKM